MKVTGFNGSPHKEGNTAILINYVFKELEKEGIETELVQLAGKKITGCTSCLKCFSNRDGRCSVKTDDLNGCLEKMLDSDGIILGSPTYFTTVTPEIKALIDRCGMVVTANGELLKHKAGAAVVAVRRAGGVTTYDALNHFLLYNQMFVPGSSYWNVGIGFSPGDVEKDAEGIHTMQVLGRNMAWLMKRIK